MMWRLLIERDAHVLTCDKTQRSDLPVMNWRSFKQFVQCLLIKSTTTVATGWNIRNRKRRQTDCTVGLINP